MALQYQFHNPEVKKILNDLKEEEKRDKAGQVGRN